MAEYIKREAAMDIFGDVPMWDGYYEPYPFEVHCAIVGVVRLMKEELSKVATADVAPVVHGRWEWFDEETGTPSTGYEREWGWRCSHCKEELPDDYDDPDDRPAFRFCYNCGAKMDGGADNA